MHIRKFLIVLILAVLVYSANFWGTSIYILDEAKNASCAMEMYQRGDLTVPTFNGELRTDKPPLHYYFMIMAYRVLGINPFSARLFSVIAGVLTVIVVFAYTRKFIGESIAFFSALAMIASLQLSIQFHLAVPDPYLILLMTLSFFLFYDGFQFGNKTGMLLFYAVVGLAFLTKGLIAIVLPGLVILLYLLWQKELRLKTFRQLRLAEGIVLFVLIAVPWYAAVGIATEGAWLEGFFLKHNVSRFTSTMEGHRGFPLAPFAIVIGGLLPFSVFIIQSVVFAWKKRMHQPFLLYCLLTGLVIAGFFCFSRTILPSYPAPALPFFAIVIGCYLHNVFITSGNQKRAIVASLALYVVLMLIIPIAVYVALDQEAAMRSLKYLSVAFIVLPAGALAALYFYLTAKQHHSLYSMAASWMITGLFFFYWCYPQVDKQNPVTQSLHHFSSGNRTIAYYGAFNPAYVFAFRGPFEKLSTAENVADYFQRNPSGLLITYKKYVEELQQVTQMRIVFQQKDLFEKQETVILSVISDR
ncbi:glycosyltransferase family 39 protein [Fulvivirgaceae bacterium PWU4]|uniref:Glycosyltransferase family 39 protein n=1 Tax=Chryseosolibacter histidini TaxID=2782349 RepID=A0AAP2DGM8_9BACT|nr:glycosyltransferase family 39 protein [Chryseosolibacter histidini]MBT1695880.1 glycosyltransferase family 39 protein [Chryseosolibacter histidini]